jgi:hypothetical protein
MEIIQMVQKVTAAINEALVVGNPYATDQVHMTFIDPPSANQPNYKGLQLLEHMLSLYIPKEGMITRFLLVVDLKEDRPDAETYVVMPQGTLHLAVYDRGLLMLRDVTDSATAQLTEYIDAIL